VVVAHHGHDRAVLETVHERAHAHESESVGTDHPLHAALPQPLQRGLDQRVGDCPVVDAVEEVEMADPRVVVGVVGRVVDRADGANRGAGPPGHEEARVTMFEEGAAPIEHGADVPPELRHPLRASPVEEVRELHERAACPAPRRFYGLDGHLIRHACASTHGCSR
jgi:hypothetical protein